MKKWVPVKEKLVVLKKNTEPYVQKVSSKSVEVYEASWDAVKPHVAKVKEFADPYFQVLRTSTFMNLEYLPLMVALVYGIYDQLMVI